MHLRNSITALLLILFGASVAGAEPLTLRINDTAGGVGGRVALVLRTYAPRPVGQGQICLRARRSFTGPGGGPLAELDQVVVFSTDGDAVVSSTFDPTAQEVVFDFLSTSGSVNTSDGPLAVLFFRLADDVSPGEEFFVDLDGAASWLNDPSGQPIPLDLRGGDLMIRFPGQPYEFDASGDEAPAGGVAVVGAETSELFQISAGRATLLYDPALVSGTPTVVMDPRHGDASFTVDDSVAGRVVVDFSSSNLTLNQVPGNIVSFLLPLDPSAPLGPSPISLDSGNTWLIGSNGLPISLRSDADQVVVLPALAIFADGFESGNLGRWIGVGN